MRDESGIHMEQPVLTFEQVTGKKRRFARNQFVLQNITFSMEAGYIYGLMGENGAGKTTLMNYILNETILYEGHIYIEGIDIRTARAQSLNHIGFVSEENPFFAHCTCRENAKLFGVFYDKYEKNTFYQMMDAMNLPADKIYGKMSRGERLKFQLAFAIAHRPSRYMLDEVTAGMDPVFRTEFFHVLQQLIAKERVCILMSSHLTAEIETRTDYVGVMEKGKLVLFGESLDIIPQVNQKCKKGEITE